VEADVPSEGDLERAEVEGVAAVDAEVGLERALDEFALIHRRAPPEVLHGRGLSPAAGERARVLAAEEVWFGLEIWLCSVFPLFRLSFLFEGIPGMWAGPWLLSKRSQTHAHSPL
jgi:hypothetical protein